MLELQSVWGWQPALYLFLGGMGAGAFAMASILYLREGVRLRRTVAASAWLAIACLVLGLLCLLTELTNPLRGMLLWQSFSNMGSWMSIGAWILVAALVVFGLFAVLITGPVDAWLTNRWPGFAGFCHKLRNVLAVCGILLGLAVAAYTGILLMSAPGVPLWNTWLLPCLFTISGLDTGVALVELVATALARKEPMAHRNHKLMAVFVVVLVIAELVVLALFLGSALSGSSQAPADAASVAALSAGLMVSGPLAYQFWSLVIACGLALPLVCAVASLARKSVHEPPAKGPAEEDAVPRGTSTLEVGIEESEPKSAKDRTLTCIGATGALVGGCALRFLVLMAGLHADPVAGTMADIFQSLLSRL